MHCQATLLVTYKHLITLKPKPFYRGHHVLPPCLSAGRAALRCISGALKSGVRLAWNFSRSIDLLLGGSSTVLNDLFCGHITRTPFLGTALSLADTDRVVMS